MSRRFRFRPLLWIYAAVVVLTFRILAGQPGAIDTTFDPGAGALAPTGEAIPIRAILALNDGSLLIGGGFTNYNGTPRNCLAKIRPDGKIDENFVPSPYFDAPGSAVYGLAVLPNGQFLVAGVGFSDGCLQLNTDGSNDAGFVFNSTPGPMPGVAARKNGSMAVGGYDLRILDRFGMQLVRYEPPLFTISTEAHIREAPDGTLYFSNASGLYRLGGKLGRPNDVEFASATMVPELFGRFVGLFMLSDFAVQSDGGIACAGMVSFDEANQRAEFGVGRILPNGDLDRSFAPVIVKAPPVQLPSLIETVAGQADDRVIIGGAFTNVAGFDRPHLARINADGILDQSFAAGAGPNGRVQRMTVAPDGKLIIAGTFTAVDGVARPGLARVFLDEPSAPMILSQPHSTNAFQGADVRLFVRASGTEPLSYQWSKDGVDLTGATNQALLIADIRRARAGDYRVSVRNGIGSAMSDPAHVSVEWSSTEAGAIDVNFAHGEGVNAGVFAMTDTANGQWVIGGNFSAVNGEVHAAVARLNGDGSLDENFNQEFSPRCPCMAIAKDATGRLIAGFDAMQGGTGCALITRINVDGTIDLALNYNDNYRVFAILPLRDGSILVGGDFLPGAIGSYTNLVRLNEDGSSDPSFDSSATRIGRVYALAEQANGKVIVGTEDAVLRVLTNGVVEKSIKLTSGNGGVHAIAIQSDGRIIIGGSFTAVNGVVRTNIARLNSDFSVDSQFNPGAGIGTGDKWFVRSLFIQSDGNILVGGTFQNLAGHAVANIGRLLPSGQLDETFVLPDVNLGRVSENAAVYAIRTNSGSGLVIGGIFSDVNGYARGSVASFYNTPELTLSIDLERTSSTQFKGVRILFPATAGLDHNLEFKDGLTQAWGDLAGGPFNSGLARDSIVQPERYYRARRTAPDPP